MFPSSITSTVLVPITYPCVETKWKNRYENSKEEAQSLKDETENKIQSVFLFLLNEVSFIISIIFHLFIIIFLQSSMK